MRLGYFVWGLGFGVVVACGCGSPEPASPSNPPQAPKAASVPSGSATTTPPATPAAPKLNPVAGLGIPLYPGANVSSSEVKDKMVSANLTTTDPVDKVVAFYEKQLSVKSKRQGALTTFDVKRSGGQYAIVITQENGATSIGIMGERK